MPPARLVVLVLDLQRDFLEVTGRMPIAVEQIDSLIAATNRVTASAAAHGASVVYIGNEFPRSQWLLNWFRRGAALVGSSGASLDPRVNRVSTTYFAKAAGDAFSNPALGSFVRSTGASEILVLGVFAGACVRATSLAALRAGLRVTLVRDAVGAASDRARDNALARLAKAGARLVSSAEAEALLVGERRT